jgi:hypothetical protein
MLGNSFGAQTSLSANKENISAGLNWTTESSVGMFDSQKAPGYRSMDILEDKIARKVFE